LFASLADWFAIGVAIALPWSTSATGILIALWLVTVLVTLDVIALKRELLTAAGGLPVVLWCLGAAGMLWADVGWHERFSGLDSFHRLLAIPILLAQFRRSDRGGSVILGFFISSTILLVVSLGLALTHTATRPEKLIGVPVHDVIFQNSEFLICGFGAIGFALYNFNKLHWSMTAALLGIAALFFVDLAIVIFSRIALVTTLIMVLLLGWRLFGWRGILLACIAAVTLGAIAWFGSTNFRYRLNESALELRLYLASGVATSIGQHATFLEQSVSIFAAAPLAGHGTGSIPEQFRRISAGRTGDDLAIPTVNPHNQTFAIGIQLGIVGAMVLWAMWIAHLWLFRGHAVANWLGLLVVVDNIVSSTVHSHLFDFANGWLYVFAVGVLGGVVLKQRVEEPGRKYLATDSFIFR
jgi:hypothetical protein